MTFKDILRKIAYSLPISKDLILKASHALRPLNPGSPVRLNLEITLDCNLNCKMCTRQNFQINKKNMTADEFKHIIDNIGKLEYLSILGLGEPMINPDFWKMLNKTEQSNLEVMFITNGTLLTEQNIKKLTKNIDTISFSIEDTTEEGFQDIRGYSLKKILNNLRNLTRMRPDINLTFSTLLFKNQLGKVTDILKLLQETGGTSLHLLHLLSMSKELDDLHPINSENFEETEAEITRAREFADKSGLGLDTRHVLPSPDYCFAPWVWPHIGINGDVYPCCYIYESRVTDTFDEWYHGIKVEVPQKNYVMGNVFKENFSDIWNNEAFHTIRKQLKKIGIQDDISLEKLDKMRADFNYKKAGRFEYCNICLHRLRASC